MVHGAISQCVVLTSDAEMFEEGRRRFSFGHKPITSIMKSLDCSKDSSYLRDSAEGVLCSGCDAQAEDCAFN